MWPVLWAFFFSAHVITESDFVHQWENCEGMLSVRCFTCNNMIGHKWDKYLQLRETMSGKESLDSLELTRVCCRRMILTHVPIINDSMSYGNEDKVLDDCNTEMLAHTKEKRVVSCR